MLVWGEPVGPGGYLDAELLDGRRGLVPSHFAQRLIGKNIYLRLNNFFLITITFVKIPGDDLLEFHQAVLSTLREEEINAETFAADVQRLTELGEASEGQEDDGNDTEQGNFN